MRRSKWLGFVATAFCALMLGAGTGVATQSHNDHRPADGASQYGKVDNGTEQHADSSAETKQQNKNTPFALFADDGQAHAAVNVVQRAVVHQ